MQRQQIEWEVSCHSLWDMAHMSARVGDISQHQILSSTHPLLISLSHSLSRRKNKERKGWTRVRKKKKMEKRIKVLEGNKISLRSSTWASTTSHPMVSSRAPSSHYLEINHPTLIQIFSLAWMDHEDGLVENTPRLRIKYTTSQSSQDLVGFPLIWTIGCFARKMRSLTLAWKQGWHVLDS